MLVEARVSRNELRHKKEALSDPELVDQHPELRAVLVIADALREEVGQLRRDQRYPRRSIDGLRVDTLPQLARRLGIRRLHAQRPAHRAVDRAVAELAQVLAGRG